jgi:hypothetical protein
MIERWIVLLLIIAGVAILLYGSSWGFLPLSLGLALGVIFYRMERKTYHLSGEVGYYEIIDAKLTSDEE